MRRALGCLCFWLAMYLLSSCAHRLQKHQIATRTEETSTTWQTAETAESNTQSVATEKKQGTRQTRRWTPDGKLMEEVIEHWGSDGRVQVASSASASASATGQASKSVAASSSSTTKADTRAGWPSWWWLTLLAPAALVAYLWKRWRARLRLLV